MKGSQNRSNNTNKNNKYNRNKSFGDGSGGGSGPPNSPWKKPTQPARRCVSHDAPKLTEPFVPDDDGFTTIGTKKKGDDGFTAVGNKKKGGPAGGGAGGRFSNETNRNNRKNNNPRGGVNPTSSFTRPRSTGSFHKPRPTGSFKKGRDNNRSNMNSSSQSFDGSNDSSGFENRRTRSFNKPRPTGSFNANHKSNFSDAHADAQAKRDMYKRSTSRLTAYDVELFTTGDGKTPAQRSVSRLHVDVLMRARLSLLDPPTFGNENPDGDTWGPHHKCLWSDPTRTEQIEAVMTKYPNAIPLHMKKRNRIVSSKLGDATALVTSSSSVMSEDISERDDISIGTSVISHGGETLGDASMMTTATGATALEDMNPLRKTLMLLNKLSWTTIGKLTPRLFDVLELDVPNLMPALPTSIKTGSSVDDSSKHQDNSENSEANDSQKDGNNNKPPPPTELSPMVITILTLIVEKAQTEPHFSAMYAQLCKSLAERNMAWRKKILAHCQLEFEHDIAWHTQRMDERLEEKAKKAMEDNSLSTNGTTNTEDVDRDYQLLQLRKQYLGHVQFIGELFKLGLIKLDIMIWCLSRLLFNKEKIDEDDLECFTKLMTVVGETAEALVKKGKCHNVAEEKWYQCWDRIYWLTGRTMKKSGKSKAEQATEPPPKISSRIKFMLVDLLELEENDWVLRRENEKAKTIDEIHKEVREEEEQARRRAYSDDFSGSFGGSRRRGNSGDYSGSFGGRRRMGSDDFTRSPRSDKKPVKVVDDDGFTQIPKKTGLVRRAKSDVVVSEAYNKQNKFKNSKKQHAKVPASPTSRSRTVQSQIDSSNATPKIVEYPDPEQCKDKTKTILKEYFVGGDTQDAILSIDELVGVGKKNEANGSVERGAAVVESGVLLVLEMKLQEVQKFLAVFKRCLQQKKIAKESLPLGLKDPLEFLSDIEIDAPLARSHLTSIVAYWVRQEALPFNFFLEAPDYFKTDGKPAEFAAGVLKVRGDDPSDDDLSVIEQLMTEDDKKNFSSPKDMVAPHT